jgi:hypothetical protein
VESDLRPGDVLLSCGFDAISRLISKMDGGAYSHTAVWDGENVVEAITQGVGKFPLHEETDAQWYVDVYRWHTDTQPPHMMGEPEYPPDPVTKRAGEIAATKAKYAYDKLLMGAFLIWVSKQPDDVWLRKLIRLYGDDIERWINDHILNQDSRGITCTEVVCNSFWEAAPPPRLPHDYKISIRIDGSRNFRGLSYLRAKLADNSASAPQSASEYDAIAMKFGLLYLRAMRFEDAQFSNLENLQSRHADVAGTARGLGPTAVVGDGVPPFFVSPRELQQSPNLVCIGRLSERIPPLEPGSLWREILEMVCTQLKVAAIQK